MQVDEISLLWPNKKSSFNSKDFSSQVLDDLDISGLCANLYGNQAKTNQYEDILSTLSCDKNIIGYRQEIFNDLIENPVLTSNLRRVTDRLDKLELLEKEVSIPNNAKLFRYFCRLKELKEYADCFEDIITAFDGVTFRSKGFTLLFNTVKRVVEDLEYIRMKENMAKLSDDIGQIKSITLGLNLNHDLNPIEATILSFNNTAFNSNSWLVDFQKTLSTDPYDKKQLSNVAQPIPGKRHPFLYHLYIDTETCLRRVAKDLEITLKLYKDFDGKLLKCLLPELRLYISFAELILELKKKGLPFCRPEIADISERQCTVQNAFNINLALYLAAKDADAASEMILNDISFNEDGRILILSGPNRGGKSVYTEAIGLIQILFQAGLHVPGTYARISPVDMIFTHFPADENRTVEYGRLGEELKRMSEIFEQASPYSLILMNESFTSTSFAEGLYIAQDVIKSIKFLGARALLCTHMHKLADCVDEMNACAEGDSKIASLVAGLKDGNRSYKITSGAPLGKSYASDITMKYGICYDQVSQALMNKVECFDIKENAEAV